MSATLSNTPIDAIDARICAVLRRASERGAKYAARAWNVSPRTVEGWRQHRRLPISAQTIDLMAACDALKAEVDELVALRKATLGK